MTDQPIDTKRLRELAEKATPGQWEQRNADDNLEYTGVENLRNISSRGLQVAVAVHLSDAAYLAALSPDVVLRLLDRIEALEKALKLARPLVWAVWYHGAGPAGECGDAYTKQVLDAMGPALDKEEKR